MQPHAAARLYVRRSPEIELDGYYSGSLEYRLTSNSHLLLRLDSRPGAATGGTGKRVLAPGGNDERVGGATGWDVNVSNIRHLLPVQRNVGFSPPLPGTKKCLVELFPPGITVKYNRTYLYPFSRPVTIHQPRNVQGIGILQRLGQQVIREALESHRSNKAVDGCRAY